MPLIKSVALSHGFWHPGQFSHDYRETFSEMLSDALARTRGCDAMRSRGQASLKGPFHCMAPQRGWRGHHRLDRLSCRRFAANAVRLQLHTLAYNLGNFLRTLAVSDEVQQWSMTTLRQRLAKIGARIVRHGRSIINQIAEFMVSRSLSRQIRAAIAALRSTQAARC